MALHHLVDIILFDILSTRHSLIPYHEHHRSGGLQYVIPRPAWHHSNYSSYHTATPESQNQSAEQAKSG